MTRTRKLQFVLDDSSLSTPQELEEVEGTWITAEKDGETRQIFIPKLDRFTGRMKERVKTHPYRVAKTPYE